MTEGRTIPFGHGPAPVAPLREAAPHLSRAAARRPAGEIGHRADIDGLRALAIVPVVLFHYGIPGFGGGYVGVDVFFVISGYLITGLIHQRMASGTFRLGEFYERRIRRIFPAMFAMTLVTVGLAAFFYLPDDFKYLGQNLVGIAFFSSNVLLWLKSGYFDHAAQFNPLLHLWSLAVEEQYYIVWPLLLSALSRMPARAAAALVFTLFAASLAFGVAQLGFDPGGAFYLMPGRAWELMAGSILALGLVPLPRSPLAANAVGLAGAAMILLPVACYSASTPFPGLAAIAPCLGAALIIASSHRQASAVGRVLAMPALTAIGRISYSLYLWHWPVVVMVRYALMRDPRPVEIALILPCTVALAIVSYRFVERPFRQPGRFDQRTILALGAAMIGAAAVCGAAAHIAHGFPGRLSPAVVAAASAGDDINPRRAACDRPSLARITAGDLCRIGAGSGGAEPTFVLYGDSFGDAMMPGIDRAAATAGLAGYSLVHSGCLPLPGVGQPDPACDQTGPVVLRFLRGRPEIRTIVIVARWSAAVSATRIGAFTRSDLFLTDGLSRERSAAETGQVAERALARLLEQFGDRRFVVLAYSPEQEIDVPRTLALDRLRAAPVRPGVSRQSYDLRQAPVHRMLDRLAAGHANLAVIDLGEALCNRTSCPLVRDGRILYADDNHLSRAGALMLAPIFAQALGAADAR